MTSTILGGLTLHRGTWRKAREIPFMKICDLCKNVTDRLHAGPKGAEKTEICDACEHDLMVRITKLQQDEARMRDARWAAMIENWKTERSTSNGISSTSADQSFLKP